MRNLGSNFFLDTCENAKFSLYGIGTHERTA